MTVVLRRPYLLERGQRDVEVADGGGREALGAPGLLEEREAAARLLAVVPHLRNQGA